MEDFMDWFLATEQYKEDEKKEQAFFNNEEDTRGHSSGSRVRFKHETTDEYVDIHRPHLGNIMKEWMLKTLKQPLAKVGLLK